MPHLRQRAPFCGTKAPGNPRKRKRPSQKCLWTFPRVLVVLLAGLAYLCGFRKVGVQGACVGMFTLTVLATIWR
jgi:hypothetical protein